MKSLKSRKLALISMQQQMSKTEVVDDNDNLAADNSVHAF